ncbi:MAG: response regulator [Rhodospirillales bacterium]|nr:response regulator [Rhodospirillales bacterium]
MRKIIDLREIKFLVVDDSPFSRSIVKSILRALGARAENLHEAADGGDALEELAVHKPDIAIVDYKMEPMDGIQLTKAIRRNAESPARTMPIIMLSAFTGAELVATARDAGVTEYVSKPISIEALYLRIEEVVQRPRQFVIAPNFVGPDRRRRGDELYAGPGRRASDHDPGAAEEELLAEEGQPA